MEMKKTKGNRKVCREESDSVASDNNNMDLLHMPQISLNSDFRQEET